MSRSLVLFLALNWAAAAMASGPTRMVLNNPGDEVLRGDQGGKIAVVGTVGRLIIEGGVGQKSMLDIRGLVAGSVILRGDLDGQSSLKVGKTGEFSMTGKIDQQSSLSIRQAESISIEGKVDGQSHVLIRKAGSVVVGGKVDGQTVVEVETCRDFRVVGKVDGGPATMVRVEYTGTAEVTGGTRLSSTVFKKKKGE